MAPISNEGLFTPMLITVFNWQVGGSTTTTMELLTTGLTVNSTAVTSDQILNFSETPLTNALYVISRLQPVEYDQDIQVRYLRPPTPQPHGDLIIKEQPV